MALPKGFRNNIRIVRPKTGLARREQLIDDFSKGGTFLPRGVMYEDMDKSFIEFVDKDLTLTVDGEKVQVIFLTLQRWSEFSKTWQHSDKYKNIKMPFITIVRQPNPQVGNNQSGLYNIPGRNCWTYYKVPTFEGGRKGIDVYKVPQPTSVDITYEVRIFSNKMRDLNKFNVKVLKAFNSIQYYIRVKGHPMPLLLNNVGDESNIDDFENRRFYVQPFEIVLEGFIIDEDDFTVVPAINRALVMTEVLETPITPRVTSAVNENNGTFSYNVIFKPQSNSDFSYVAEYDSKYTTITNSEGMSNIFISVNGVEVLNGLDLTSDFIVTAGDTIFIKVTRVFGTKAKFTIIGDII
tara:strand:+ start:3658 stop:4710 length:1053 start_codon:yes stop_codon:yes gene_type:complete